MEKEISPVCNLEKERCLAKRRPGHECPAWVPSLPGKGPTGNGWGLKRRSSRHASRPGRVTAAELYLHNASTFSPGGTCGAIPSRPLRRRSWCAPFGLWARRAPDTFDAGRPCSCWDLALPRRTPGPLLLLTPCPLVPTLLAEGCPEQASLEWQARRPPYLPLGFSAWPSCFTHWGEC